MSQVLYYLIQVVAASGLLYGYYHLFLRNNKFHHYNRYFLLAAVVLSLVIPFLNIPLYFSPAEKDHSLILRTLVVFNPSAQTDVTITAGSAGQASWLTPAFILNTIYWSVAMILALRIILSIKSIFRMRRTHVADKFDGFSLINTNEPGTPFSFFRWLFWNRDIDIRSQKGEQVFRHEWFHIRQWHSLDLLFMETVTMLCWINPFFHLIKKEVKAIHEFLADEYAVQENNKWDYAELLLMQVLQTRQSLVNPFFHNQIKRRIAMITSSDQTSYRYLRKILVLPLAFLVMALFAFTYKIRQPENKAQKLSEKLNTADTVIKPALKSSNPFDNNNITLKTGTVRFIGTATNENTSFQKAIFILNGKIADPIDYRNKYIESDSVVFYKPGDPEALRLYGEQAKDGIVVFYNATIKNTPVVLNETQGNVKDNLIFTQVEQEAFFPGGDAKWRQYLERNLDASIPVKNKAPEGRYTVNIRFVVDKNGKISDMTALTGFGFGMEEEAIRVIKSGPYWQPAQQNNHEVTSYRIQPITFLVGTAQVIHYSGVKNPGNSLNEVVVTSLQPAENDLQETPPSFPGGTEKWKQYLVAKCNMNTPVDSGAPAGNYKAIVKFIVKKDGTIADIQPVTHLGYGTEKELIRLISQGPRWVPAMKNGQAVDAYIQQPLTFVVSEESVDAINETQVVFIGINNPVTIQLTEGRKYIVEVSKGSISETSPGHYNIVVATPGEFELTVSQIVNGIKTVERKQKMIAKLMPDPVNLKLKLTQQNPD
ncbi:MAG: energy transducer TonB [Chitinophagaceae bacterium]|nr:energy transducer TonB [Chitinophagaceae bacterium]